MKKLFKRMDKVLLFTTIILFIVGLIMIFSASNITAYVKQGSSPYSYFLKQGLFISIGCILFLIIIFIDTKYYKKTSFLALIFLILSLLYLLKFGSATKGANSWIPIGPFGFQPSEFVKIFTIIYLSCYFDKLVDDLKKLKIYIKPFLIVGIVAICIYKQPDLGTLIIYASIVAALFLSLPFSNKVRNIFKLSIIGVIILAAFIGVTYGSKILTPAQYSRIDYTKPCSKFITTGNQVCNGYIAINNGGLFGVGLGNSTQKYLYLPEPYTDFIFCIIMEELGLLKSIIIIIALMLVIYRILVIAKRSYTNRGAMICYATAVYIFAHIFVNLGGIFGIIPLTGVPLPFLSYGGSYTWCLIIALAIVQRVAIENKLYEERYLKSKLK